MENNSNKNKMLSNKMRRCKNCKMVIKGRICYIDKMRVCKSCFDKIRWKNREKRKEIRNFCFITLKNSL